MSDESLIWICLIPFELGVLYLLGRRLGSRWASGLQGGGIRGRVKAWLLLAPGTVLHESSHALACLLTGVRVRKFVPFHPVLSKGGGVRLGYVEHDGSGPLRGALIGMAPLLLVPGLIYLAGVLLLPGAQLGMPPLELVGLANQLAPGVILWWLLTLSGSVGAAPSPSDHRDLPAALLILGPLAFFAFSGGGAPLALLAGLSALLLIPCLTLLTVLALSAH